MIRPAPLLRSKSRVRDIGWRRGWMRLLVIIGMDKTTLSFEG